MKKNILVTGAAGFIGFHFTKAAYAAGCSVTCLDNFNDYYDVRLKHARHNELKKLGVEVMHVDICDRQKMFDVMDSQPFTHVVHLAAQAGVRYSFEKPEVYLKTNIEGFLNVLECLKKQPHIRLIYASSSSVYGANEKVPFSVNDITDSPTNVYGMTKKSNELMAFAYNHLYGISSQGMRFFTVYGPWGRPDMAYFSFTKAIIEGRAIAVYDEGRPLRDFTYIDDVVAALMQSLECSQSYALFNIGNNKPESVSFLIELIEKETGRKAVKNFLPMQKGEIHTTYADISKAEAELKFTPKTSLAKGIHNFVSWYHQYYEIDKK
jgi:UDP-glucuronate 4-epimerase